MSRAAPTVGLLGVPFDANSSFRRGPARAPAAIRRAMSSEAGNAWSERGVRVWPNEAVVDHGDLKVAQRAAVRGPIDAIERGVARALAITPRLLLLGGDHAVSYPAARGDGAALGPVQPAAFRCASGHVSRIRGQSLFAREPHGTNPRGRAHRPAGPGGDPQPLARAD